MEQWKSKRLEGSSQPPATHGNRAVSIYEALSGFIRYIKDERRASPCTLNAYERDLLQFAAGLEAGGKVPDLIAVTSEDVRAHMHAMIDRSLSTATVRRSLYAIGSFFNWAIRWDLMRTNPVARVTVPRREPLRDTCGLSRRERALLVAAADAVAQRPRWALYRHAPTLVRLMLKTGLRRSEVINLTWRDISLERGDILVRCGKGRKSRRVPIADGDLLARLTEMHNKRQIGGLGNESSILAPVFTGTGGKPISFTSFYRLFRRIVTQAELGGRGITPHALRHTFGSMLCDRGVPVPYVKELLGHADIESTMVYVHSTPAALRQAVKRLGD